MSINNVKSNTLTQALIFAMNSKKSNMRNGFHDELKMDFGKKTIFIDGTHSSIEDETINNKEVDIVIENDNGEIKGLIEVKAGKYEPIQPSQTKDGEYQKLAEKLGIPLYYFIPENYSHIDSIPDKAVIVTWNKIYDVAKDYNDYFASQIIENVEGLNSSYFNKDDLFLNKMLYNREHTKEELRKTFNGFFEVACNENVKKYDSKDWNAVETSVYSVAYADNNLWLTLEYLYDADEQGFCCHYVNNDEDIDEWFDIDIDFTGCNAIYDRAWYLIETALPQYEAQLGKKVFKKIFRSVEQSKEYFLHYRLRDCSDSYRISLFQKIIDKKFNPVLMAELGKNNYRIDGSEYEIKTFDLGEECPGICIHNYGWDDFDIKFEINKGNKDFSVIYGIHYFDEKGESIPARKNNALKKCLGGFHTTNWWAGKSKGPDTFSKLNVETIYGMYMNPEKYAVIIKQEINKIIKEIKKIY